MTPAQLQTLKADIAANTNTINGVQIKDMPNSADANDAIANWYSAIASPDFFVFRSNIPANEISDQVTWANYTPQDAIASDGSNAAVWHARSLACQGKQFNLQLLLPSGQLFNAGRINLRAGLNDATTALPSGANGASRSGGWTGILAILRRQALRVEKLFAVQTSGVGVTGGDPLGGTTNPALLVVENAVTANEIDAARNLP